MAIRRDIVDWRLKNACPACTYVLQDEKKLRFSLLYTMDGNDSLKWASKQPTGDNDADPSPTSGPILPGQLLGCDRYLSRDEVDVFDHVQGSADLVDPEVRFNRLSLCILMVTAERRGQPLCDTLVKYEG